MTLLRKDPFLVVYSLILVILIVIKPQELKLFYRFIDWRTIASLTGLLIITKGMELSGYFDIFSRRCVYRITSERGLFLALTGLTAVLSTFLTNDVALFLVVPLTLSFAKNLENDLGKLIIFEAIAANAGSSISPIGNPQNIFIYRYRDIPFHLFFLKMLPVGLVLMGVLAFFIILTVPSKELKVRGIQIEESSNRGLLILSVFLFILFVIAMELNLETIVVFPVILIFLFVNRDVVSKSSWSLLLLFVIFFVVSSMLSRDAFVRGVVVSKGDLTARRVFFESVILSQILSNVPAAILMSHYTTRWIPLAAGVNVGGNGLLIASLANIIAIRLSGRKDLWIKFHLYSIPILVISVILIGVFLVPIFK